MGLFSMADMAECVRVDKNEAKAREQEMGSSKAGQAVGNIVQTRVRASTYNDSRNDDMVRQQQQKEQWAAAMARNNSGPEMGG